jgi:hypothetical protein
MKLEKSSRVKASDVISNSQAFYKKGKQPDCIPFRQAGTLYPGKHV